MTRSRWGLAALTAVALAVPAVGSPVGATAAASEASVAAADAVCTDTGAARVRPGGRQQGDTAPVTAADLAAIAGDRDELRSMARDARRELPTRVDVPVHVNLVSGTGRGETNSRTATNAARWVSILNAAYAGAQSGESAATRYTFVLTSVRSVRNDRWFHAVMGSEADKQMRRTLHRGGAKALNLYVTRPGADLLGFARFPWQYAAAPLLDGVTVSLDAMPGGRYAGYNRGDTLVHEVGHWMGLFHTFQPDSGARDGCGDWTQPTRSGDRVADTPPQKEPSEGCPVGANTCTRGESTTGITFDPVHNFMDYSTDACMNQFTPGQVARMDTAFETYRIR